MKKLQPTVFLIVLALTGHFITSRINDEAEEEKIKHIYRFSQTQNKYVSMSPSTKRGRIIKNDTFNQVLIRVDQITCTTATFTFYPTIALSQYHRCTYKIVRLDNNQTIPNMNNSCSNLVHDKLLPDTLYSITSTVTNNATFRPYTREFKTKINMTFDIQILELNDSSAIIKIINEEFSQYLVLVEITCITDGKKFILNDLYDNGFIINDLIPGAFYHFHLVPDATIFCKNYNLYLNKRHIVTFSIDDLSFDRINLNIEIFRIFDLNARCIYNLTNGDTAIYLNIIFDCKKVNITGLTKNTDYQFNFILKNNSYDYNFTTNFYDDDFKLKVDSMTYKDIVICIPDQEYYPQYLNTMFCQWSVFEIKENVLYLKSQSIHLCGCYKYDETEPCKTYKIEVRSEIRGIITKNPSITFESPQKDPRNVTKIAKSCTSVTFTMLNANSGKTAALKCNVKISHNNIDVTRNYDNCSYINIMGLTPNTNFKLTVWEPDLITCTYTIEDKTDYADWMLNVIEISRTQIITHLLDVKNCQTDRDTCFYEIYIKDELTPIIKERNDCSFMTFNGLYPGYIYNLIIHNTGMDPKFPNKSFIFQTNSNMRDRNVRYVLSNNNLRISWNERTSGMALCKIYIEIYKLANNHMINPILIFNKVYNDEEQFVEIKNLDCITDCEIHTCIQNNKLEEYDYSPIMEFKKDNCVVEYIKIDQKIEPIHFNVEYVAKNNLITVNLESAHKYNYETITHCIIYSHATPLSVYYLRRRVYKNIFNQEMSSNLSTVIFLDAADCRSGEFSADLVLFNPELQYFNSNLKIDFHVKACNIEKCSVILSSSFLVEREYIHIQFLMFIGIILFSYVTLVFISLKSYMIYEQMDLLTLTVTGKYQVKIVVSKLEKTKKQLPIGSKGYSVGSFEMLIEHCKFIDDWIANLQENNSFKPEIQKKHLTDMLIESNNKNNLLYLSITRTRFNELVYPSVALVPIALFPLFCEWFLVLADNNVNNLVSTIFSFFPKHCYIANLLQNRERNRDENIIPSDRSRPEKRVSKDSSNIRAYYNATFINGHELRYLYLLAQCPLKNETLDFIEILFLNKVGAIVVLDSFSKKKSSFFEHCINKGTNSAKIGNYKLSFNKEFEDTQWIHTKMIIRSTDGKMELEIVHFTFKGLWTKLGEPLNLRDLLNFRFNVRKTLEANMQRMLIYEHTETGKSGLFTTLDYNMRRCENKETTFDIIGYMTAGRSLRSSFLMSFSQLKVLIHLLNIVVKECSLNLTEE